MTDKLRQSGRPSRLGFAKQSAEGTYAAPTDIYKANAFDFMLAANVQTTTTLAGALDATSEAQQGIPELSATLSGPLRAFQGLPILKAGIGTDTLSGAADVTVPNTLSTLAAGASTAAVTSIPAPPSGIADWAGAVMTISDGTHTEKVPINNGSSGTTLNFAPITNSYSGTITLTIKKQHCLQPNTGANIAILDFLSFCAQYAYQSELQVQDAQVFGFNVKNNGQNIEVDYTIPVNALYPYDGDITTTITAASGENSDRPFTLRNSYLLTYGQASDTVMVKHKRLMSLGLQMQIADQKVSESGTSVVQHVPGDRTWSLTWSDDGGESAFSTFQADFVSVYRETPALLYCANPAVNTALSFYMPKCAVKQYQRQGPTSNVISYSGQAEPMLDDANTGIAIRVWADQGALGTVAAL